MLEGVFLAGLYHASLQQLVTIKAGGQRGLRHNYPVRALPCTRSC